MTVERSAGATSVSYDPETAQLTVERDGTALATGRVRVAVDDDCLPSDRGTATVVENGIGVRVTHEGPLETTVRIEAADAGVDVSVAVTNDTDQPVALRELSPLADATTPFADADRMFEHGYQSWTPTAALPLDDTFPSEPPENRPQMLDLAAPDDGRTSHYLTALSGDPGHLTMAFLDHDAYLSRFDVTTGDRTRVSAVCPGDGVTIPPGGTRRSATLRIDATRPVEDALPAAAAAVGDRMDARTPTDTPTGWCSWYHYFTDVTADDVRTNVDALREWDVPVDIVQVDDGYETAFGDWRTLDEGFSDMGDLGADIEAAGYRPGLWLAPFYVQGDSDFAADHPEWLVTDGDGEPVDAGERHGEMYGLDTTHPEANAWLEDTFETIVDEWGFSYLKLDFLYAAALPGERHDDVTRAEAYRRGMKTIRAAVGEDTFLLGCGAPAFPSVGIVEAMRVGPDTAPYWRRDDDPASEPAHENAIRNVLNRQFCHRRLWVTDPDCQLVRTTTQLTDAERRAFATVVALTGGANVFSDAVEEIDAAGRDLLERTLPPISDGTVEGVGYREFPDRMVAERPADGALAIAAFNWTDEDRTVTVAPADRFDGPVRVWDPFAEQLVEGPVERSLDPHDVLLLHCVPARDRPHLVGSRHLANAAGQVGGVEWTGTDDGGRLTVDLDAPRPMELVVAVPEGWTSPGDDGAGDGGPDDVGAVRLTADPGVTSVDFERGDPS
ncbi:glycoside hydrolase family 36 protein [Halobaculum sp. EA56]|uniref:glycoside hydrolase family 36 protein n=1 Tax=Halobaculum sp. EA56 TaxID=3421648 RepID=UPI003EBAFB93